MPVAKPKFAESPIPVVVPAAQERAGQDRAGQERAGDEFSGQRRLIRPSLPARSAGVRPPAAFAHGASLTSRAVSGPGPAQESSYAEVFYFQKQIQSQTRMVVVLENGMEIEGIIEWYDRYAIKLRNVGMPDAAENGHGGGRNRVLIYKDGIRYIYKAGEDTPQTMT